MKLLNKDTLIIRVKVGDITEDCLLYTSDAADE